MAEVELGYFERYGLQPANVAKATSIFLVIGLLHSAILFLICYFLKPTNFILRNIPIKRVQDALAKVEEKLKGGAARTTIAFTEASALKVLMSPVMLPLKIWAAVEITRMLNVYLAADSV
jgi:hypothetical protein